MAQTTYENISAGGSARQHNGNVTNNNRYYYGLRTRRSDETLREDQRNLRLLRASAEGQLHRIQHLLRLGADVDFSDETEFTALHYAVLSGFEDCVQELVKWGSDVNAMTCYGVPLDLAAQKERNNVISILLGARADKSRAIAFAEDHGQKVSDLNLLFSHTAGSATMEVETWPDATCRNETRDEHQPLSAAADDGTEKEESNMEANDDCSRFRRSTDDGNGFGNDEKYIPDWQHCLPADADNVSLKTTKKDVKDYFGFCSRISDVTTTPDSRIKTTKSYALSFEREVAAKTALLLDNTQRGTDKITVTAAYQTNDSK